MSESNVHAVLRVDFNNKTLENRVDNGVSGAAVNTAYCKSYNGSTALYIDGELNPGYITFDLSKVEGFDLSRDDFTVNLWFRGIRGGLNHWLGAADKVKLGTVVDMPPQNYGGVLWTNRDESNKENSGFCAVALPQHQFLTVGVSDGQGKHKTLDGMQTAIDNRWHKITVSVDRSGLLCVYVDAVLCRQQDISGEKGQTLGCNAISFGADLLGHYGLQFSCIDDIAVCAGALSEQEILDSYYVEKLAGLSFEAQQRMALAGPEYTQQMKATLCEVRELIGAKQGTVSGSEAKQLCAELKAALDAFLLAPEKDAKMVSLMLGDIHIALKDDPTSKALADFFQDAACSGYRVDNLINAGDLGNSSAPVALHNYFNCMDSLMDRYDLKWNVITSLGNHDIQYTNPEENYQKSVPAYWERLVPYISNDPAKRVYGDGKLDSTTFQIDEKTGWILSCSYAITCDGYHFVVINTDYLEQTGCSKNCRDENGKWSIEGNQLDPIRHGLYLMDSTLEWLDKTMDTYSKDGKPIFVIAHFPFIDSCPLSYYRRVVIDDNSIGKQDHQIRSILASYDNVVYFCGHLHHSMAVGGPVAVETPCGTGFTQINMASIKNSQRGYGGIPAGWIMYVYDKEIVLRGRDFKDGIWLTEYDQVIPLK